MVCRFSIFVLALFGVFCEKNSNFFLFPVPQKRTTDRRVYRSPCNPDPYFMIQSEVQARNERNDGKREQRNEPKLCIDFYFTRHFSLLRGAFFEMANYQTREFGSVPCSG